MRKRKGAALPSAVILSTFLLVVSFAVSYLVIQAVTLAKLSNMYADDTITFSTVHNKFVASDGDDSALPTDTKFSWQTYDDGVNDRVIALVACSKADETMKFYSIYDFEHDKLLAYQTSEFYITSNRVDNKTTYYLAGLIPYREVIDNA